MKLIKKPAAGGPRARERVGNYPYNSPLRLTCQDLTPISRIIQRILTELLVLKRYPLKSSSLGGVRRCRRHD